MYDDTTISLSLSLFFFIYIKISSFLDLKYRLLLYRLDYTIFSLFSFSKISKNNFNDTHIVCVYVSLNKNVSRNYKKSNTRKKMYVKFQISFSNDTSNYIINYIQCIYIFFFFLIIYMNKNKFN